MKMSFKRAIERAILIISALPETEEKEEIISRLNELKDKPFITNWTKELVFERLNEWKDSHGRNPTMTDLAEPGMPKAAQIKRLFDMKATAFLNIYYPSSKAKHPTSRYTQKSKDEYIEEFITQYERIKPRTEKEYNAARNKESPTWMTIARYVGVTSWGELLKITKVDTSHLRKNKEVTHITVTYKDELMEHLVESVDKLNIIEPSLRKLTDQSEIESECIRLSPRPKQLTYRQLTDYISTHYGMRVSSTQIAYVKRRLGLPVQKRRREKEPDIPAPCPVEKAEVIEKAMREVGMV